MAVIVQDKKGNDVMLLNPFEKGQKMFHELQNDVHLTNDMQHYKTNKDGKPRKLSDTQKAYRSGYLQAQKDARRAFRAKNPHYKNKVVG